MRLATKRTPSTARSDGGEDGNDDDDGDEAVTVSGTPSTSVAPVSARAESHAHRAASPPKVVQQVVDPESVDLSAAGESAYLAELMTKVNVAAVSSSPTGRFHPSISRKHDINAVPYVISYVYTEDHDVVAAMLSSYAKPDVVESNEVGYMTAPLLVSSKRSTSRTGIGVCAVAWVNASVRIRQHEGAS